MGVPQSVRDYLYDGSIRRAINELIGISDKRVLDGLEWRELRTFYRAQLAARQFESEWAIFGVEAWDAVWGDLLSDWTPLSIDQQIGGDYDSGLSLADLRYTDDGSLWFGRVFERGSWTFYPYLWGLLEKGLTVSVALVGSRKSEFPGFTLQGGNWMAAEVASLDGEAADLSTLRSVAKGALEAANSQIAASGRRSS